MNPTQTIVRGWWREALGAALVLVSRILTAPRTPWENDEFLFAEAVRRFDPSRYHPHPPGFPLLVLIGKVFAGFVHDPWRALVVFSIIAAPIGFVAIARAFRNWLDNPNLAICAALIYYFSASMLVHGTLALSDGPAMMFLGLALFAISSPHDAEHDRNAIAIGIWTSAAIGTRPQLLVPIAPMLLIALLQMRTMRQRAACVIAFGLFSAMWFLPLVDAAGGFEATRLYETKQAAYVAAHDASVSRGGKSMAQLAVRFLFHPWGTKYVTLPLFASVFLGVAAFVRLLRRDKFRSTLWPLVVFTIVQLVFELGWMDPADAARYSLPVMIPIALLAVLGLDVVKRSVKVEATPAIVTAIFAIATLAYVWPLAGARTKVASPPAAAAAFVNANLSPNSVIAYDVSLKPHAEYLLSRFRVVPIEKAVAEFYDRPDVPLYLIANGASSANGAQVFTWPASDAYEKLTRELYRTVSIVPKPPRERYLPVRGVYPIEWTAGGDEWRWLGPDATIRLPRAHGSEAALTLRFSSDVPFETNAVQISINARNVAVVNVGKEPVIANVPLPPEPLIDIRFRSAHSFSPGALLHNADPRTLAVQLTSVVSQ
ncbi:MAG: glycosyltransferase family 39 protein [Acidobacteria bacterium]|nr:glycosyltransferase family 39 protein [Acidobacteriota bacterium]MBV9070084.1 glycosyltransferase family 39 protein [Acidobacteriota bacterium]MBV9185449.1 glycosyltransferase family 39 protein [Acidobacteriota bacterium]